jgi:beta-lactamase class D
MATAMRRLRFLTGLMAAVLSAAVVGCAPQGGGAGSKIEGVDHDKLEAAIDKQMGGIDTCVVVADAKDGRTLYQYGDAGVCMRNLPPCETFDIANSLIGLQQGLITTTGVVKWDGTPQPVEAWQTDANLGKAFKGGIGWWFQKLAQGVGHDGYVRQLKAFDYGDRDPAGPVTSFWMGPHQGGGLGISTRQQVAFLKRFYDGSLPGRPQDAAFVRGLLESETRADAKGQATMTGQTGSCASQPDGSRNVGWWIGRLKTPAHDLLFAASLEAANAPPGSEVEERVKDAFADAGLWPAGN